MITTSKLAAIIKVCTELTILDLCIVRELYIASCDLFDIGTQVVADGIVESKTLRGLSLSNSYDHI